MNPVLAFVVVMAVWTVSDLVAKRTRSLVSSLLVASVIFLVGFLTDVFPDDMLASSALLGLGGVVAAVRGARATQFLRFAGVVVLAFALVNVQGALGVLAPGLLAGGPRGATTVSANVTLDGDVQVLRTTQVATGYEPEHAVVYAGREVRWEIESVALGCATSLWAPDLGIAQLLDLGTTRFSFMPTEPGTIRYSCAMGMFTGTIEVIPDPEAA